jgi:uncharacterized coiled-coil protein SlyX
VPSDFSVVAIIAAYNEADIIGQVVADLIRQGIHIYFLDDGSDDCTTSIVEQYVDRGVLGIERLAGAADGRRFDWERILLRKTELARQLDATWFIHHDADEFRESPWPGLSLREAIRHVDTLGFNAIDFAGFDFAPTVGVLPANTDVRELFTYYSAPAEYDRVQVRCWKKNRDIDLVSTGGHEARFAGRRVFPIRFIMRHYPIRGQRHGERKVFSERRNRFVDREVARGWHRQYEELQPGTSFVHDPSTLTRYDAETVRRALVMHPRYPDELEDAIATEHLEVDRLRGEVAAVREQVVRFHSEVMRAEADLASRDRAIAFRDAEIGRLHARLAEQGQHIADLHEQLDAACALVVALRIDVDQRNATIAELNGALVRMNQEIVDRNADVAHLRARIAAYDDEVAGLKDAAANRLSEIQRWRTTVDALARQLDEMRDSASWRLTAPIRAAARTVRGK